MVGNAVENAAAVISKGASGGYEAEEGSRVLATSVLPTGNHMFCQSSRICVAEQMILTDTGSELAWIEVGLHKHK